MTQEVKKIKPQKVTKEFQFKLSHEDREKLQSAAGALDEEIDGLTAKMKEASKEWKDKIKKRSTRLKEILKAFNSGEEKRQVEALMYKDFEAKEIRYEFNGVVVERRAMTPEECQMEIENVERKTAKPVPEEERGVRARGVKQRLQPNGEADDVGEVHQLETRRGSKHSAVDGPTRN